MPADWICELHFAQKDHVSSLFQLPTQIKDTKGAEGWAEGRPVIIHPFFDIAEADMRWPGVPSSVQKEVMAMGRPAEHVLHTPSEEFFPGFGKQPWGTWVLTEPIKASGWILN